MGTRSLTRVIPRQEGLAYNKGHEHGDMAFVNMYRHYDGYPEGHGLDLAEFLKDMNIINGISGDVELGIHANGSGCLAAQMVKHFKEDVGYISLYPTDNDSGWEDYIYTIFPKEGEPVYIAIYRVYTKECIFVGTPQELIDKYTSKES
mgnify:FL=1